MDQTANTNDQDLSLTIYVGDLSSKTLESDLFRIFSSVGEVSKIKLRKRQEPQLSFAFVTFTNPDDAKRAVKEYNNYKLNQKNIRVSHCLDNNEKKEDANIIVKNLPANFTNENLYDAFLMFGEIISAKVATYADGKKKNYGFIQFKKRKSAKLAIKHCNGGRLDDKIIQVEIFDKDKRKRQEATAVTEAPKAQEPVFTNCFMKNFPKDLTEEDLTKILSKYGEVTSIYFPLKDDKKTSVGYAFANFSTHAEAKKAIEELHGKVIFPDRSKEGYVNPEPFYIQRGQKKEEREEQLKKSFELLSMEGQNHKRNLYVTNIPSFIEKQDIIDIFSEFGTIVSVSIGNDATHENKKYAFVCYTTPEEAFVAFEKGNEIFIEDEKLNVTYFKNKVERAKEKMMASVNLSTSSPYIYNAPIKITPNSSFSYDMFSNFTGKDTKLNNEDRLYELVLRTANTFKHQWQYLGVNTKEEFAEKLTKILSSKSTSEIEEMKKFNGILSDNITNYIEESKKNEKK